MNLSNEERETHLNMVADDRSIWHISSDDPVMQRKLEKVGATLVSEGFGGTTKFYTLPANQVTIRRAVVMSEERKAELSKRMRALHLDQEITRAKGESGASDG